MQGNNESWIADAIILYSQFSVVDVTRDYCRCLTCERELCKFCGTGNRSNVSGHALEPGSSLRRNVPRPTWLGQWSKSYEVIVNTSIFLFNVQSKVTSLIFSENFHFTNNSGFVYSAFVTWIFSRLWEWIRRDFYLTLLDVEEE